MRVSLRLTSRLRHYHFRSPLQWPPAEVLAWPLPRLLRYLKLHADEAPDATEEDEEEEDGDEGGEEKEGAAEQSEPLTPTLDAVGPTSAAENARKELEALASLRSEIEEARRARSIVRRQAFELLSAESDAFVRTPLRTLVRALDRVRH